MNLLNLLERIPLDKSTILGGSTFESPPPKACNNLTSSRQHQLHAWKTYTNDAWYMPIWYVHSIQFARLIRPANRRAPSDGAEALRVQERRAHCDMIKDHVSSPRLFGCLAPNRDRATILWNVKGRGASFQMGSRRSRREETKQVKAGDTNSHR
jgi:hypothetical protein